jgi:hypothetical protein
MTRMTGAPPALERKVWEREMRTVRTVVRILSVVLAALLARALITGLTTPLAIAVVIVGGLLLAALALYRRGRAIEPD